jgi:glutaredoxin 3
MAKIIMYKTQTCPFCVRAEALFKQKGISDIQKIDVTGDDALRAEMMEKAGGRRTVPQIFINGKHVGGCDDLYALNDAGKLDAMLAG